MDTKHLEDLRNSTLTDETIARYEITSLSEAEVRAKLGRNDITGSGWLIQYPESHFFKIKLDNPLPDCKYLSPSGMEIDLFITNLARGKEGYPLYFCEGEKKALALEQLGYAAIGLNGVWGWKSKGRVLPAIEQLVLKDRPCCILYDADKYSNAHVLKAEYEFALYLRRRGAKVGIVNLDKALGKGIDDQIKDFISKGNIEDLKKQYIEAPLSYEEYIARNKSTAKEKLTPAEIAAKLCQEQKIIYCGRSFYAYQDGVYQCIDDEEMREKILWVTGLNISFSKVEEILKFSRISAFKDIDKLNDTPLLNLKNGLFNIDTYELLPHNPDIYSTIQLNVTYEPTAKCEKWIQALFEILQSDEEKASTLQEFFGLCLTRETRYEKALICIGEGANGKSVLLNTLEKLIGEENCTSIPLEKFNDAHYTASLFGKIANISIETKAGSEVYDSVFKAIISGDPVQADLKFKNSFKFRPFCKLIFAVNNLPRVDDKTNAFFRRLLLIRFEKEFTEIEQNKLLKEELLTELDGIFIWCLEGLRRLRARRYFDISGKIDAEIKGYQRDNNNVIVFIEEECRLGIDYSVDKKGLYAAYQTSCKENGHRPVSKNKFGAELKRHFKDVKDDRLNTGRIWRGIELSCPVPVTQW